MDEKTATNVTAESSAPEAAKSAENESAIVPAGGAPASSAAEAAETSVSVVLTADNVRELVREYLIANALDVAQIYGLQDRIEAVVREELRVALEDTKADILAHLMPMVAAITNAPKAAAVPFADAKDRPQLAKELGTLEPDDPVKVWTDPEHKTFRVGEVVAVHDGGHAFDVKLDDGSVTKVPADGLEYDDRR